MIPMLRVAFCLAVLSLPLRAAAAEPLRVGVAPDYPPLAFREAGQLTGLEIEFARRLGTDLKRKIEFVELPFPELIPSLEKGSIDVIMTGMSITDERSRRVRFLPAYFEVAQMVLVRGADRHRFDGAKRLDDPAVRVGFVTGTTGHAWVRGHCASAQQSGFSGVSPAIEALRASKIDALVHDAPSIWHVVGGADSLEDELTGLYVPLTREKLAWAVRLDDEKLSGALERELASWRESGWLDEQLLTWIRVRKVTLPTLGER
jgi:polar amino acid transport system substrate-binding protein